MYNKGNNELDREIEALEKEIFGTPGEEPIEETIETGDQDVVVNEPLQETVKTEQADSTKSELEALTKRFNNYKASNDVTTRDLRSELANSKTKYGNLQKEYGLLLQKLQLIESSPSSRKKMFTEEEVDILGEPAANALDKGVNDILEARMKPLQEELERTRQAEAAREIAEAERLRRSAYDDFIARLAKAVPDYAELNISPGFLQYMKEVDEYSGVPRERVFANAEKSLDVGRIASFFKDYQSTLTPSEKLLESAITPVGNGAGVNSTKDAGKDEVITAQFIDKFYDDYSRGKYKSKAKMAEANRIETLIERAVLSGQVQYNTEIY